MYVIESILRPRLRLRVRVVLRTIHLLIWNQTGRPARESQQILSFERKSRKM
jgi:hypothetical protein